jgi:hypothetical protein
MTYLRRETLASIGAEVTRSDVAELSLDPEGRWLRVSFSFSGFAGGEGRDIIIELMGLVHVQLIKDPEEICPFFAGDVSIEPLDDGGVAVLPKLSSRYILPDGGSITYGQSLYYFRVDGGIALDVACQDVRVYREVWERPRARAE